MQSTPTTTRKRRVTHDPAHPDYPHGTTPGYSRGCRCQKCRAAHSNRIEGGRLASQYGAVPALVDAAPSRARLTELIAAGVPLTDVADAVGTSCSRLSLVSRGRTRSVHRDLAARVLAINPTAHASTSGRVLVPRDKAIALIRSLQYNYWTVRELEAHARGFHVRTVMSSRAPTSRATETAVLTMWQRIGDRHGTGGSNVRSIAVRHGALPPAAYTDDGDLPPNVDTDDGDGNLTVTAITRALTGSKPDPERHAANLLTAFRRLLTTGCSGEIAVDGLDLAAESMHRRLRTLGVRVQPSGQHAWVPTASSAPTAARIRRILAGWSGGTHDALDTLVAISALPGPDLAAAG